MYKQQENLRRIFAKQDTFQHTHSTTMPNGFLFFFFLLLLLPLCVGVSYLILFYQSPLILTELFQHDLINVSYLTACDLYQVMMTLHFLNDVAYDAESTQTSKIRHDS